MIVGCRLVALHEHELRGRINGQNTRRRVGDRQARDPQQHVRPDVGHVNEAVLVEIRVDLDAFDPACRSAVGRQRDQRRALDLAGAGRDLDRPALLRDEHPSARQEPEVDRGVQTGHDRGPVELRGRRDVTGDGHRTQRAVAAVGLVDDAAGGHGQIGAADGVRRGIGDQRRHHGVGSGVDRHDGVVGACHEQQTPAGVSTRVKRRSVVMGVSWAARCSSTRRGSRGV